MKFYNWINEDEIPHINEMIQRDCKPYLKLIDKINGHVFTRSMDVATLDEKKFGIKKVRKNRRPRGMGLVTFQDLNDWLEKNGHYIRNISVSVWKK